MNRTMWEAASVRALSALVCLTGMSSLACESEEPDPLIVGVWDVAGSEIRYGEGPWLPYEEECILDNVEEFLPDGGWTLFSGPVLCEPGAQTILTGTWRLAAGDTKVVYTYDIFLGEYDATIEVLTESDMVLIWSTGALDESQFRRTYVRQ